MSYYVFFFLFGNKDITTYVEKIIVLLTFCISIKIISILCSFEFLNISTASSPLNAFKTFILSFKYVLLVFWSFIIVNGILLIANKNLIFTPVSFSIWFIFKYIFP